ncbi:MAG: TonB family protein [Burkholderiaceae bacterium]|jgi:protein TonB|nr:TonB family protein [Burkholderiaceae bacterium]
MRSAVATTGKTLRVLPAVVALAMVGCSVPPAPTAPAPASAPAPTAPPQLAKRSPEPSRAEADWRRAVAQHIQSVNAAKVFEGRPPNPLKAVVVLDVAVAADGRLQRVGVLRAPAHARELGDEAIRTIRHAAPLPAPPQALLNHGSVRFTETWLFREDDRFQLRTLAQTQLLD